MTLGLNEVYQGDCYSLMSGIEAGSIDAVITDLPFKSTNCSWDQKAIDLAALWQEVRRVLRPGGAFITTAAQPFTTHLINSNLKWFRYDLVYKKRRITGFLDANRRPLRNHETILVFCDRREPSTYNPQKTAGKPYISKSRGQAEVYGVKRIHSVNTGDRFPVSVLEFDLDGKERGRHPTQKPLSLYRWLIKTYTNPGQTVLDPFAGSGTTGVAAVQTGRNYIMIEREEKYAVIARNRLAEAAAAHCPV